MEDASKVSMWLGIAASAVAVLAFLGINNFEDVRNALGADPEGPSRTSQPVLPATSSSEDPYPESTTPSFDTVCLDATNTISDYLDLTEESDTTNAAAFEGMATDLTAHADATSDPDLSAAIRAIAADARVVANTLPATEPSDVDAYRAALREMRADLGPFNDACAPS